MKVGLLIVLLGLSSAAPAAVMSWSVATGAIFTDGTGEFAADRQSSSIATGGPTNVTSSISRVLSAPGIPDSTTGLGIASADLETATLRASGLMVTELGFERVTTYTNFNDTFEFILPTGMDSATVRFAMDVEGDIRRSCVYILGRDCSSTYLGLWNIDLRNEDTFQLAGQTSGTYATALTSDLLDRIGYQQTLFLDLVVTNGMTIGASFGLQLSCLNSAFPGSGFCSFDFGNTATAGLIVPDGVSYRSGSGVFATRRATPAAIPEPSPLALVAIAFAIATIFGAARSGRRSFATS